MYRDYYTTSNFYLIPFPMANGDFFFRIKMFDDCIWTGNVEYSYDISNVFFVYFDMWWGSRGKKTVNWKIENWKVNSIQSRNLEEEKMRSPIDPRWMDIEKILYCGELQQLLGCINRIQWTGWHFLLLIKFCFCNKTHCFQGNR